MELEPLGELREACVVESHAHAAKGREAPREIVAHGNRALGEEFTSAPNTRLNANDHAVNRIERALQLEPR